MSKRLILFSQPSPQLFDKLAPLLFGPSSKNKFAYMPSDGSDTEANDKYTPIWQDYVKSHHAEFVYIDNSKRGVDAKTEADKILSSNILMITGGNTFQLLKHLRESGLDQTIIQFWQKDNIILSGFSAGALVLTPSIANAGLGLEPDPNLVNLTDLRALGIVDFFVWPHYTPAEESFVKETEEKGVIVHRISNDDLLVINQ